MKSPSFFAKGEKGSPGIRIRKNHIKKNRLCEMQGRAFLIFLLRGKRMKKVDSISLRTEIYPHDMERLIEWMENPDVTCYLNEDDHVADELRQMLLTVPAPMLAFHLNRLGRFSLVCDTEDSAIGFIKLKELPEQDTYEIVIVIGEEDLWGRGYGAGAVHMALNRAFLEWHARKVVARIHVNNHRSIRMMCSCGFTCEHDDAPLSRYGLTLETYLHG